MRQIPPLAAVRVFEAAARHLNFTVAATELGMTQAAVSYQIRLLEERLGVALFRRERRRVLLTDAGTRAAAQVSRAFDTLDEAFADVRAEQAGMLTITTSQTFANAWLAWRLGGFQMAHPEMAVRLSATDRIVDLIAEADVAIRVGLESWPGLTCERLFVINFTPMCSPEFLDRHGGALRAQDLLRLPLISAHDPWWPWWLGEAGVDVRDALLRTGGVRLDSQANEGNAAIAGQGVAMLTPFFWRNDIAQGRLVRPFAQVSSRGYGYWLVYPEHRRNVPKIKHFREWLQEEVERDLGRFAGDE